MMKKNFKRNYTDWCKLKTIEDIENRNPEVFDEEFLICTKSGARSEELFFEVINAFKKYQGVKDDEEEL